MSARKYSSRYNKKFKKKKLKKKKKINQKNKLNFKRPLQINLLLILNNTTKNLGENITNEQEIY